MDSEWCIVCEAKIPSSSDAVPSSSAFCSSACLLKAQSDARSRSTSPVLFPPGGGPSRSRRSTGPPSTHRMASYASAWVRRASGVTRPASPRPTAPIHDETTTTTTTTSDLDSDAEDEDEGLQIRGRPRHRRFWDDSSEGGAPSLSTLNTSATDEGSGGGNKAEEDLTVRRRPSKAPRLNPVEERASDGPSPASGTSTAGAPSPATTGPSFLSMSAPPPPPLAATAASGSRSQPAQDGRSSSASSSPTHPLHLSRRARSSADRLASFLASIGRPPSAPRGSNPNPASATHRHARPSEGGTGSDDADVSEDLSAVADAFMAWGGVVSSSPSASLSTSNRGGGDKAAAAVVGGDEVQAIHESVFRRHKERRPAPGRKAGVVSPKGWGLAAKGKPGPPTNPASASTSTETTAKQQQQQQQRNGSTTPIAFRSSSPVLVDVGRGRDEGRKDIINRGTGDLLSRIEDAVGVGAGAAAADKRGREEEVKERGRDASQRRISSSGSRGRQADAAPGTAAAG